jgi:AraC-like DNA-binding protein
VLAFARDCQLLAMASVDCLTDDAKGAPFLRSVYESVDRLPKASDPLTVVVLRQIATSVLCNGRSVFFAGYSGVEAAERLLSVVSVTSTDELRHEVRSLVEEATRHLQVGASSATNARVLDALRYLHVHYGDESLKLERVSAAVRLSKWRLLHLLRENTGMTFLQHLRRVRTEKAQALLNRSSLSVKEVANQVGYSTVQLNRAFKRECGVTPSQWRGRMAEAATISPKQQTSLPL